MAVTEGDEANPETRARVDRCAHSGEDVKQMIAKLNPVLRGWGNYFRTGNADRKFNQLDIYVYERLVRWM